MSFSDHLRGSPAARRGAPLPTQVRVEPVPEVNGFSQFYEEVANNVQTMNSNVQSLRKLADQVGTRKDTQQLRESLYVRCVFLH